MIPYYSSFPPPDAATISFIETLYLLSESLNDIESAFVDSLDWRIGWNKFLLGRYFSGDAIPTDPSDEPTDTALEVSIC